MAVSFLKLVKSLSSENSLLKFSPLIYNRFSLITEKSPETKLIHMIMFKK